MDFRKACNLEGFLEKKSPSFLKGYQKRHFAIRNDGMLIVYSKKKIVGGDVKPKGVIPIDQIQKIARIKGSEREFVLEIGPRQMLLRAPSNDERDTWTTTIAYLQEQLLKKLNNPDLSLASKNSFSIRQEGSVKLTQKASWKELDQETKTLIMMDKEKQDIENGQEEQDIKNEEVMKSKGLYAYLEKFDPQKFRQFVKCGFLLKKGKMAKLTKAKKRWFILISSVSLLGDDSNIQGPNSSDIPDAFKLNYLYYFAYESRGDQSSYLGKINAEEIEEFELMNVDKNNSLFQVLKQQVSYGFTFRFKERQYHFFSESMTEIQAWVQAIRAVKVAKAQRLQSNEPVEELQIKKEDILLEDKMQVKIHRKIRKDKWFERKVYLKKDSINWAQQGQDDTENYVLIISIKSVVGADNEIHIYTKDEKIFKFKASSEEVKEEWLKKLEFLQQNLRGEFKDIDKATELPPEVPKEEKKSKKANSEEKSKVSPEVIEEVQDTKDMVNIYENFFSTRKDSELSKGKKQKSSFLQKLFCCCPNQGESDRGF